MKQIKNKQVQYKTTKRLNKAIIDEILKIEKSEGLTAENLLEKAKSKKSKLHNLFDWNDNHAANQWRIQQARVIINEVKIIIEDKEMFAFENVRVKVNEYSNESSRAYKPIVEIMNDKEYRKQILRQATEALKYWKQKYEGYHEFNAIFVEIDKVDKELNGKSTKRKRSTIRNRNPKINS